MFKKIKIYLLLVLFVFNVSYAGKTNKREVQQVAKGIKYIYYKKYMERGPVKIHVLKVSVKHPDIDIVPAFYDEHINSKANVKKIALQHNAVAAINASFFTTKKPVFPIGRTVIDGESVFKSEVYRSVFGLTYNNNAFFKIPELKDCVIIEKEPNKKFYVWGINRPRKQDEIILYTSYFGEKTGTNSYGHEFVVKNNKVVSVNQNAGDSEIPEDGFVISLHGDNRYLLKRVKVGDSVWCQTEPDLDDMNIKHMLTGGPRLIKKGNVVVHPFFDIESFAKYYQNPNSRSAVGVNNSGEILFVMVEKSKKSVGATFSEMAWIMKGLDVVDAMGLDGGSSASMYVKGKGSISGHGGKYMPKVNNALLIMKRNSE